VLGFFDEIGHSRILELVGGKLSDEITKNGNKNQAENENAWEEGTEGCYWQLFAKPEC
jgi:hypothetical protein